MSKYFYTLLFLVLVNILKCQDYSYINSKKFTFTN